MEHGAKEILSGINGVWNRVTLWTAAGEALYCAHFGPGEKAPAVTLADMDVCDLDGDGRKEVVVASREGLVVALDCKLEKLWAKRTPAPPLVLRCVDSEGAGRARVVVGCEDGTVVALGAKGELIRQGAVSGRPSAIMVVEADGQPLVAIGTGDGEVKVLRAGE